MGGRHIEPRFLAFALIVIATLNGSRACADPEEASYPLQLEVFVNGESTKLVGAFSRSAGGRITATRKELRELGIKAPAGPDQGGIDLSSVVDDYRYDAPGQRIYVTLDNAQRLPKTIDLRGSDAGVPPASVDVGAVLNYQVFASSSRSATGLFNFNGGNATLDGRVFGSFGYASQSAILGTTTTSRQPTALRLETTYTYSQPDSLRSLRAGDLISSALPWARSIRLGGVQLQRDFSLRPDLVVQPLPSISGSAAVPSTLDIYVNNVRLQSQDVPPGPFEVTNIPAVSPAGSAQVVLRESSGRVTQMTAPFYTSPRLLRGGIYDYSIEVGAPRLRYAVESNHYSKRLVGSASLRGGVFDWLTVEAHAEGSERLQNLGLGVVMDLAARGVLSLALSGSRSGDQTGANLYAALDTRIGGLYLHASSQRSFGRFLDLAASTAAFPFLSFPSAPTFFSASPLISALPPLAVDTFSVGAPVACDLGQLSAGYVHIVPQIGRTSNLLTLSYSRPAFSVGNIFVNGFADLSNRANAGVFAGLSMPLESAWGVFAPTSVGIGVTRMGRSLNVFAEAIKTIEPEPGSVGWRVRNSEGALRERLASIAYRSAYGQWEGYVQQFGKNVNGGVTAQGAIAAMGGGLFFANRIDDAFAVVDAGAPNVDVKYENRAAGKTNGAGLALIPMLRSFQRNKIDIDTRNLPVNAEAERTKEIVAPANRGGVVVRFGVKSNPRSAIVIFTRDDGRAVEAGAEGRVAGATEPFIVGYDGRAYIKGLDRENHATIDFGGRQCRATFRYADPDSNRQAVIGPVPCRQ